MNKKGFDATCKITFGLCEGIFQDMRNPIFFNWTVDACGYLFAICLIDDIEFVVSANLSKHKITKPLNYRCYPEVYPIRIQQSKDGLVMHSLLKRALQQ